MGDISWISDQAKQLHAIFEGIFYSLATVLLVLGVILEYFKFPLGGTPAMGTLVGRVLIAAILLSTYPEVSNAIADVTDALAQQLGNLNEIKLVLDKMGTQLHSLTVSWTGIKDLMIWIFSFVTFFLLYISVFLADAAITYAWVILYVFSPLLIVMYILPATSSATKTLYRSLFEVSAWKIVWSVLATLLWSSALSQVNQPGSGSNFITVICFNLILAGSLLATPWVVSALMKGGISSFLASAGGFAAGAAMFNPASVAKKAGSKAVGGVSKVAGMIQSEHHAEEKLKSGNFPGNSLSSGSSGSPPSSKTPGRKPSSTSATTSHHHPPEWHNDAPPPKEPPGWMQSKLAREQAVETRQAQAAHGGAIRPPARKTIHLPAPPERKLLPAPPERKLLPPPAPPTQPPPRPHQPRKT